MKPSFFSLFKRGRYYHPHPPFTEDEEPQSESVKSGRREVERFAVAAVAFCLEHDEPFRKHFWERVCKQDGDPELKNDIQIGIEDKNWSDLKLTSGDCVCTVEFKVGAPLERKQDPNHNEEFWGIGGYGGEMLFNRVGRYRIIGKCLGLGRATHKRPPSQFTADLRFSEISPGAGIYCGERLWRDLSDGLQPSNLVKNLFDSLGMLGILDFKLMETKKIEVIPELNDASAAKALVVIQDVKTAFGLTGECESWAETDNSWSLGSRIDKASSDNKQHLVSLTGNKSSFGWLGFENLEKGPKRYVWIYCADKAKAEQAEGHFANFAPEAVMSLEDGGEGSWNLIITDPKSAGSDYEWFAKVFRKLGLTD